MIIVSVTGFTNETVNLFTSHALRVSGEDTNKVVCACENPQTMQSAMAIIVIKIWFFILFGFWRV